MIDLIAQLATYLAEKLELELGAAIFYNDAPDEPNSCVLVQEIQTASTVPAQIDASVHRFHLTARDVTYTAACGLVSKCWRWLFTDLPDYSSDVTEDTTGFITLPGGSVVLVTLYGNPVWEKTDQQRRKYYGFYFTVVTSR